MFSRSPADGGFEPSRTPLPAPSVVRRLACWIYEGILLFAVTFFSTWIFSTLGQMRSGIDPRRPLLIAVLFVVIGIYFSWFWSKGQTLPMKTWHIRVVDAQGRDLTQKRAMLRYLCAWLWFLPPLALCELLHRTGLAAGMTMLVWIAAWAAASRFLPGRQFLHDLLAGTRLIDSRRPS